MKLIYLRCILLAIIGLNISAGANASCDPGPYNGYWHSDELEIQIIVSCHTNDAGNTYPDYYIWSSEDRNPLSISDAGNHLKLIFQESNVIIHRPNENYQLLVDRMRHDETQWQRFYLSLPSFEPANETSCPISCLRPIPICQASPFDGYWTDDASPENFAVQIRSACGVYASGADFFLITVEVYKDGVTLPASSVSENGDHLTVDLADFLMVVSLPKDNQISIDRQEHGKTQWHRTSLKKQEKP